MVLTDGSFSHLHLTSLKLNQNMKNPLIQVKRLVRLLEISVIFLKVWLAWYNFVSK